MEMLKLFGHLVGILTQRQGGGCITNQGSFPLGLCLTPSGTRTSAFALSMQPYQQSLATGLSVSTGGGNSMRGHQRAAHPRISVI